MKRNALRRARSACVVLAILTAAACSRDFHERLEADEATVMPDDHPAMQAAMAKAKSSLDQFLQIAAAPAPHLGSFAVKIGISDQGSTEYFWITPFSVQDGHFSGMLSNTPQLVSNVSEGQVVKFDRGDIVDWTYMDSQQHRMYGNYTACALLQQEGPEAMQEMRKNYGLQCD